MVVARSTNERDVSLLAKDQYFRAVRHCVRLTPEQEQDCWLALSQGRVQSVLPHPDERVVAQAQQARTRLVESCQGLVIHLACRYQCMAQRMALEDLIQEGNVGLLLALRDYDPHGSGVFVVFASVCIRHALLKALWYHDALLHGADRQMYLAAKAAQAQQAWAMQYGREPSLAEVAALMQVSESEVEAAFAVKQGKQVKSLHELLEAYDDPDEAPALLAVGSEPPSQAEEARHTSVREQLWLAVQSLPERQRLVLTWRYGLEDGVAYSLEEIAERLGCSRFTVSAAERKASQRLAHLLELERGPEGVRCRVRVEAEAILTEPCYSVSEAAALLGCTVNGLRWNVRAGHVPGWRLPGRTQGQVYPKAAIDALVQEREAAEREAQACYSCQEAAAKLGYGRETLRQKVLAGEIPAVGCKRGKRYPKAVIDALAVNGKASVA
ncbi:MAG TPA: sigma-70 family RNA polymerase sigma factor [Ktedonobacteraceae bacterium]|nr:sigma-70 family RNA polymerase sigma factor [Ktedonobacteraceae bacterium]